MKEKSFLRTQKKEFNYYENNIQILSKLLKEEKNRCFMQKMKADPPTVTLSRIRGIIGGNYPLYTDFFNNFNKENKIEEDNIIKQMEMKNMSKVFMGDDTWLTLFNDIFDKSYPFDSFNTLDLDTVDLGVQDLLFGKYLNSSDDLIIAHMLGIDHVGHSYGPNSQQMKTKLQYIDQFITNLTQSISEDTVLLVIGDHGMNEQGNHGSSYYLETDTVLFGYCKKGFNKFNHKMDYLPSTIKQIDMVPIISYLLGLNIPFSNLGQYQPQVNIDDCLDFTQYLNNTIHYQSDNMQQILDYLQEQQQDGFTDHHNRLAKAIDQNQVIGKTDDQLKYQIQQNYNLIVDIQKDLFVKTNSINYLYILLATMFLFWALLNMVLAMAGDQPTIDINQIIVSFWIYCIGFVVLVVMVFQLSKTIKLFIKISKIALSNYHNHFILVVLLIRIQSLFSLYMLRNEESSIFIQLCLMFYMLHQKQSVLSIVICCFLMLNDQNQSPKYSQLSRSLIPSILNKLVKHINLNIFILVFQVYQLICSKKQQLEKNRIHYYMSIINLWCVYVFLVGQQIYQNIENVYLLKIVVPRLVFVISGLQIATSRCCEQLQIPIYLVVTVLNGHQNVVVLFLYMLLMDLNRQIDHKDYGILLGMLGQFCWLILGYRPQLNTLDIKSSSLGCSEFNQTIQGLFMYIQTFGPFILGCLYVWRWSMKKSSGGWIYKVEIYQYLGLVCAVIMNIVQLGSLLTVEEYVPRLIFDLAIFMNQKLLVFIVLVLKLD